MKGLRRDADQKEHSPNLLSRKCISEVGRIGSIVIFHLSKRWKPKFSILCDAAGEIWNWSLSGVKGLKGGGSCLQMQPLTRHQTRGSTPVAPSRPHGDHRHSPRQERGEAGNGSGWCTGDKVACKIFDLILLASPFGRVTTTACANHCGPEESRHWGWSLPEICCVLSGSFTSLQKSEFGGWRDGAYGLTSLSEKTWKSNHLQMWFQRQHFLLKLFYIETRAIFLLYSNSAAWTRGMAVFTSRWSNSCRPLSLMGNHYYIPDALVTPPTIHVYVGQP